MKFPLLFLMLIITITSLLAYSVNASNESSFKLGELFGESKFQKCDRVCMNLDQLAEKCYTSPQIDNVSACTAGFAHTWGKEGQTQVARCLLSGHDWNAGQCDPGKLVAISGPGHCDKSGCESGIGRTKWSMWIALCSI
jgi:hypothetical protein